MGRKKIAVIGAGKVGATLVQILAYKQLGDIVLWNRTVDKAQGIALDILESAPVEGFDVKIKATGELADIKDSDVVVITAGIPRKEGMSRDDLLAVNAALISSFTEGIKTYAPNAVLVVVTNPLDAMVYLTMKKTGFQKNRVIGMAGILDSARLREFIAMETGASVKDITTLVLGSHGDTMVPLVRHTRIGGVPIEDIVPKEKITAMVERTRNGGAEIIKLEKDSSAYYAPASSLALIVESILLDKKMVLPCSAYVEGEYGINGIFMGVPVVVGAGGIEKIVQLNLNDDEKRDLAASAEKIRALVSQMK